jgi:hypothetical protein
MASDRDQARLVTSARNGLLTMSTVGAKIAQVSGACRQPQLSRAHWRKERCSFCRA